MQKIKTTAARDWFQFRVPLIAWGIYAFAFYLFSLEYGSRASALSIVPVLVTAWYCGPRIAALAGILAFPLHAAILNLEQVNGWEAMSRGLFGSVTLVLVGGVAGFMRQMNYRAQVAESQIKTTTSAYEEAQKRLQTLLEHMTEGVLQVDNDDIILFANTTFCDMLGYRSDELIGKLAYAMLLPEGEAREKMKTRNHDRLEKKAERYEHLLRHKDGHLIHFEVSAAPVFNGEDTVTGSFGIHTDITQRKRNEEEIQRQLVELQALQQLAVAGIQHNDEDVLIAEATRAIGGAFYPDHFGVLLVLEGRRLLRPHPSYQGISEQARQLEVPFEVGVAGRVARTGQLVRLDDTAASPDFVETTDSAMCSELCVPLVIDDQVIGVINAESRECGAFSPEDERLLSTMAGYLALGIKNARLLKTVNQAFINIENAYEETLKGWAAALDLRDGETAGHSQRVTEYTLQLAQAAGIKGESLVHLRRGALLHDIGKMIVPDRILQKPGPLDEAEWAVMKQHPCVASDMLRDIDFLKPAATIPYGHHERWDGSGYPLGLRGRQIPVEARLFAVVDVWDALRSDRPYRKAWSDDKVHAYLREMAGVHFDPYLVDLFIDLLEGRVSEIPRAPAYIDLLRN